MSYGRMVRAEGDLQAEIRAWLAEAEAVDAAEDADYKHERRGDEMPDGVKDKQRRLETIRTARAALRSQGGPNPRPRRRAVPAAAARPRPTWRRSLRRSALHPSREPDHEGQDGFVQAYNGQLAVDTRAQVIVA